MRIRTLSLAVAVVVAGWLTLAPTEIRPVSWQPPKAPSTSSGVYAENSRLAGLERLGADKLPGPEALVTDRQGRIYTGLADGRVVRLDSADGSLTTLADTAGRPLALAWHPDGRLIIADAIKGLLALAPDGKLQTLVAADGALPLGFTDFVTVSADGRQAWFSDASTRWHYGQDGEAVMEHGGDGRLLRYDFASGRTEVMLSGLEFANGVAFGPNENYVLVNETGAYRISRLWLKGPHAGQHDLFIDNLPGLPDNLSFNGKDRFWVALYTPRNPLLDTFAGWPGVRKAFARALQVIPKPVEHRAMALGLSVDGQVVANLQDGARGNYSPITTVLEADEWLYFGSLTQDGIARMPLKSAF